MKQVKTSELTGAALDWAVAKCEKPNWWGNQAEIYVKQCGFHPSSIWSHGGPIIERERFDISPDRGSELWLCWSTGNVQCSSGNTPLIAAMRCYVASKLGDVVEIPEELC